jgi:hypothetical protein
MRAAAAIVAALVALAQPEAPRPPAGLACLSRWYPVVPALKDGVWLATLPDGSAFPYDDGKAKTFEEKLEAPDLEDTYSIPYVVGPIQPVDALNQDPGRIRFDPLFRAAYGKSEAEVDVVPLEVFGRTLKVHRKVKPSFERVAQRLAQAIAADPSLAPFLKDVGGTFLWRPIANTQRQSAHSYGVSMDINVARSDYWEWQKPKLPTRWRNRIPPAIVEAFEAEGFIWGGRWFHYDTMHFEYRPELLDPACREKPRP